MNEGHRTVPHRTDGHGERNNDADILAYIQERRAEMGENRGGWWVERWKLPAVLLPNAVPVSSCLPACPSCQSVDGPNTTYCALHVAWNVCGTFTCPSPNVVIQGRQASSSGSAIVAIVDGGAAAAGALQKKQKTKKCKLFADDFC